jgi:hypothetical protein
MEEETAQKTLSSGYMRKNPKYRMKKKVVQPPASSLMYFVQIEIAIGIEIVLAVEVSFFSISISISISIVQPPAPYLSLQH